VWQELGEVPSSEVGHFVLPRSLRCVAGAPKCGAVEKTGHSGRDDRVGKNRRDTQEDGVTLRRAQGKEPPVRGATKRAGQAPPLHWNR
jgi:hypothetical protein